MKANRDVIDALMDADPIRRTVTIGGYDFIIQSMTEEDGSEYELMMQTDGKFDIHKHRRSLIACMVVDEDGNRIYDNEADLKRLPIWVAGPLYEQCMDLSAYRPDDFSPFLKNLEPADACA